MYRGSRKHTLDWVEQPFFAPEVLDLTANADAKITSRTVWSPAGYRLTDEARLETWGPKYFGPHAAWAKLENWWLAVTRGANTPNWDLAVVAELAGQPGLILVEAKAHEAELKTAGKNEPDDSNNSRANHERIAAAIDSACKALSPLCSDLLISRDSHYQLSNRLAFAWKLASLGIPVALIYLGFIGDKGIADAGSPFSDAAHWHRAFNTHLSAVGASGLLDKRHQLECAPFWFLSRVRNVLEQSPPSVGPKRRQRSE